MEFWDEVLEPVIATKDDVQELKGEMGELKSDVGELKSDVGELKAGQRELKRQINDLKVDTPTQKEFEELKTKVERHHPAN